MGFEASPFIGVEELSLKTSVGQVFSDVSLKLDAGKVCCAFGEQGEGKTSLLLTLCGRMRASGGSAIVAGYKLPSQYRKIRRESAISLIPKINDVQPYLKVKSIMAAELSVVGKRGNKKNTDAFLKEWGFYEKKEVQFRNLNAYEATCFGIVLGMACDPKLLMVDDIQTNLTQHQSIKIVEILKQIAAQYGTTVLFCSGEYEVARHAECLIIMGQQAVLQRQAVLRAHGAETDCPIIGFGNGAELEREQSDSIDSNSFGSPNTDEQDSALGFTAKGAPVKDDKAPSIIDEPDDTSEPDPQELDLACIGKFGHASPLRNAMHSQGTHNNDDLGAVYAS